MILPAYVFADGVALADDALARGAAVVRQGGLIGLPTETVYGLGADADNPNAVARIFAAKGRPADHPLIVHLAGFDGGSAGVAHYAQQVPDFAHALMAAFWPGPLTVIVPRRAGVAEAAAGGQASIGLRCPAHPVAQALLHALRKPPAGAPEVWGIAAPSANRFGRISPTTAAHVQSELEAYVPGGLLVLDGGPCAMGIESTIVDCTRGAPVVLRPGSITAAQIAQVCASSLANAEALAASALQGLAAPRASGTLASHYAPRAKVRLMDAHALQQALSQPDPEPSAARPPSIAVYARSMLPTGPQQFDLRTMPNDARQAAHELFAVLRAWDDQGVQEIWVETPPDAQAWDGVRDRLQRASA